MEKTCHYNIKYPLIIPNNNECSFAFRYEFFKQLEPFLSSGLLTDYISIKLIKSNILAILSTKPAVELNIINSNLFFYDRTYSLDSFVSQKPIFWVDAFSKEKFHELKYKKLDIFGFTSAISIYSYDKDKMVSISFATHLKNNNINDYYLSNLEYLNKIAYVVQKISLPMFSQIFNVKLDDNSCFTRSNLKSKIFLVINNTERI